MSSIKFKNQILLPGQNAICEVLTHVPSRLASLCVLKGDKPSKGVNALLELAKKNQVRVEVLKREIFDSALGPEKHQGAFGILKPQNHTVESMLEEASRRIESAGTSFFIILDRLQDTNNLGSIFRLAASSGISGVFLTKNSSVQVTPTVRRVSMGGTELVPWCVVGNLSQLIERLKTSDFWIYGATSAEEANSVYGVDMPKRLALVMGSEESGLRRLTAENCDMLVNIPMQGKLESLNVSQAASVLVFEIFRQWNSSS